MEDGGEKRILGKSWRSQSEELHGSERDLSQEEAGKGTVWRAGKELLHQGWTQAPLEISKIMPKSRKGSQKNVKKDKKEI